MGSGSGGGGGGAPAPVPESELEKELSRISEEAYIDFQKTFKPVEEAHFQDLKERYYGRDKPKLINEAVAGVQDQRIEAAPGERVSDGSYQKRLTDNIIRTAAEKSAAHTGADYEDRDRTMAGIKEYIAQGRGIKTGARANLSTSANRQLSSDISDARDRYEEDTRKSEGIGQIIGGGLSFGINKYLDREK